MKTLNYGQKVQSVYCSKTFYSYTKTNHLIKKSNKGLVCLMVGFLDADCTLQRSFT
jgi:hypothetical protein